MMSSCDFGKTQNFALGCLLSDAVLLLEVEGNEGGGRGDIAEQQGAASRQVAAHFPSSSPRLGRLGCRLRGLHRCCGASPTRSGCSGSRSMPELWTAHASRCPTGVCSTEGGGTHLKAGPIANRSPLVASPAEEWQSPWSKELAVAIRRSGSGGRRSRRAKSRGARRIFQRRGAEGIIEVLRGAGCASHREAR